MLILHSSLFWLHADCTQCCVYFQVSITIARVTRTIICGSAKVLNRFSSVWYWLSKTQNDMSENVFLWREISLEDFQPSKIFFFFFFFSLDTRCVCTMLNSGTVYWNNFPYFRMVSFTIAYEGRTCSGLDLLVHRFQQFSAFNRCFCCCCSETTSKFELSNNNQTFFCFVFFFFAQ